MIDASNPLVWTAGVSAALMCVAMPLALRQMAVERRRRERMDAHLRAKAGVERSSGKEQRQSDSRRKQIASKLKSLDAAKRKGQDKRSATQELLMQAGLESTPRRFWIISAILGLSSLGLAYLFGFSILGMLVIGFFMGLGLPKMVLKVIAGRRQKEFTKHFADAVDILVRGLKSGLPVGECFNIIARESPDPVGEIFKTITGETKAGLTMEEALDRALSGMPTQELKFFSTVIAVQQQTGGNLADILSNISTVLRGRATLKEKIKALSSEARASTMIIGSLPVFVSLVLLVVNPKYIYILIDTPSGNVVLWTAIGMAATGLFIMNRMASFKD